jgi:hypothetical protein
MRISNLALADMTEAMNPWQGRSRFTRCLLLQRERSSVEVGA